MAVRGSRNDVVVTKRGSLCESHMEFFSLLQGRQTFAPRRRGRGEGSEEQRLTSCRLSDIAASPPLFPPPTATVPSDRWVNVSSCSRVLPCLCSTMDVVRHEHLASLHASICSSGGCIPHMSVSKRYKRPLALPQNVGPLLLFHAIEEMDFLLVSIESIGCKRRRSMSMSAHSVAVRRYTMFLFPLCRLHHPNLHQVLSRTCGKISSTSMRRCSLIAFYTTTAPILNLGSLFFSLGACVLPLETSTSCNIEQFALSSSLVTQSKWLNCTTTRTASPAIPQFLAP